LAVDYGQAIEELDAELDSESLPCSSQSRSEALTSDMELDGGFWSYRRLGAGTRFTLILW